MTYKPMKSYSRNAVFPLNPEILAKFVSQESVIQIFFPFQSLGSAILEEKAK